MHILIAEDNQDHAELLVETLVDLYPEIHITHKTNGEEALAYLQNADKAKESLPDMVLLDIKMPRMNGVEVLAILKQHQNLQRIPVAMLTTSTNASEVDICLQQGAVSYIPKPLTAEDFHSKILSCLQS